MNITESALIATIVLAVSGSTMWIGGKVMEQVESHTAFVEDLADPVIDVETLATLAKKEEAKRKQAIEQYAARN